jgi:hypothetical protein
MVGFTLECACIAIALGSTTRTALSLSVSKQPDTSFSAASVGDFPKYDFSNQVRKTGPPAPDRAPNAFRALKPSEQAKLTKASSPPPAPPKPAVVPAKVEPIPAVMQTEVTKVSTPPPPKPAAVRTKAKTTSPPKPATVPAKVKPIPAAVVPAVTKYPLAKTTTKGESLNVVNAGIASLAVLVSVRSVLLNAKSSREMQQTAVQIKKVSADIDDALKKAREAAAQAEMTTNDIEKLLKGST